MYQVTLLDKTSKHQVDLFLDLLLNSLKGNQDYFEWKHNLNNNYRIEEYTFCIFQDEICIATTQVVINEITISSVTYRFGLLCDGATHEDYRRLGLFEKLLDSINEFCSKKEVDFVYSTGNEKSRKALLKLGFKDFFTTQKATKRIRYNHPVMKVYDFFLNTFRITSLKKLHNIKEISIKDYSSFFANQKTKSTIFFNKAEGYLKWRLAETTGDYKLFGAFDENQTLQAVIVVKTSKRLLYIVDLIYNEDVNYVNQLLKYASILAIKNKNITRINCIHNNFENIKSVFESSKYKILQERSNTLLYGVNSEFKIPYSEIRNMHYMRIDKNE